MTTWLAVIKKPPDTFCFRPFPIDQQIFKWFCQPPMRHGFGLNPDFQAHNCGLADVSEWDPVFLIGIWVNLSEGRVNVQIRALRSQKGSLPKCQWSSSWPYSIVWLRDVYNIWHYNNITYVYIYTCLRTYVYIYIVYIDIHVDSVY